jgi:sulfite reductase (NADPH) hemoprotein beta-component
MGRALEPARGFRFDSSGDAYGWTQGTDGRWHYAARGENGRLADLPVKALLSSLRSIATSQNIVFALTTNQT